MLEPTRPALSCLLLALAFILGAPARAQDDATPYIASIEGPQTAAASELDALDLPALMHRLHVPGFSIAVVKDFKIHWAKAYGVADAATGRPVDIHTRFQAASISKPLTALAAMRLVQEGRLNLDADVNTVLTSWRVPPSEWTQAQPVTPRSLFSHTSGADDGFGFPGYAPGAPLPTVVQILDGQTPSNVGKVSFARAPYQQYKYSGGGLLIMQQAMVDLTRRPFAPFMQATVLTPLRMVDSAYEQAPTPEGIAAAALAHDQQGERMGPPWHVYPELAAAALWSTPSDIAQFVIEIQTALRGPKGNVLDQRTANAMMTPATVGPFAVGTMVGQRGDGRYFWHSGSNWGYRAWMIGHASKGYGLVMMTNGDNGMSLLNQVGARVERAYQWDSLAR